MASWGGKKFNLVSDPRTFELGKEEADTHTGASSQMRPWQSLDVVKPGLARHSQPSQGSVWAPAWVEKIKGRKHQKGCKVLAGQSGRAPWQSQHGYGGRGHLHGQQAQPWCGDQASSPGLPMRPAVNAGVPSLCWWEKAGGRASAPPSAPALGPSVVKASSARYSFVCSLLNDDCGQGGSCTCSPSKWPSHFAKCAGMSSVSSSAKRDLRFSGERVGTSSSDATLITYPTGNNY